MCYLNSKQVWGGFAKMLASSVPMAWYHILVRGYGTWAWYLVRYVGTWALYRRWSVMCGVGIKVLTSYTPSPQWGEGTAKWHECLVNSFYGIKPRLCTLPMLPCQMDWQWINADVLSSIQNDAATRWQSWQSARWIDKKTRHGQVQTEMDNTFLLIVSLLTDCSIIHIQNDTLSHQWSGFCQRSFWDIKQFPYQRLRNQALLAHSHLPELMTFSLTGKNSTIWNRLWELTASWIRLWIWNSTAW